MKTFFVDMNFNSSLNTPRYVQDPVSATADFVSPTLVEQIYLFTVSKIYLFIYLFTVKWLLLVLSPYGRHV